MRQPVRQGGYSAHDEFLRPPRSAPDGRGRPRREQPARPPGHRDAELLSPERNPMLHHLMPSVFGMTRGYSPRYLLLEVSSVMMEISCRPLVLMRRTSFLVPDLRACRWPMPCYDEAFVRRSLLPMRVMTLRMTERGVFGMFIRMPIVVSCINAGASGASDPEPLTIASLRWWHRTAICPQIASIRM